MSSNNITKNNIKPFFNTNVVMPKFNLKQILSIKNFGLPLIPGMYFVEKGTISKSNVSPPVKNKLTTDPKNKGTVYSYDNIGTESITAYFNIKNSFNKLETIKNFIITILNDNKKIFETVNISKETYKLNKNNIFYKFKEKLDDNFESIIGKESNFTKPIKNKIFGNKPTKLTMPLFIHILEKNNYNILKNKVKKTNNPDFLFIFQNEYNGKSKSYFYKLFQEYTQERKKLINYIKQYYGLLAFDFIFDIKHKLDIENNTSVNVNENIKYYKIINKNENYNFKIGDYVIINYNDTKINGIIIRIILEKNDKIYIIKDRFSTKIYKIKETKNNNNNKYFLMSIKKDESTESKTSNTSTEISTETRRTSLISSYEGGSNLITRKKSVDFRPIYSPELPASPITTPRYRSTATYTASSPVPETKPLEPLEQEVEMTINNNNIFEVGDYVKYNNNNMNYFIIKINFDKSEPYTIKQKNNLKIIHTTIDKLEKIKTNIVKPTLNPKIHNFDTLYQSIIGESTIKNNYLKKINKIYSDFYLSIDNYLSGKTQFNLYNIIVNNIELDMNLFKFIFNYVDISMFNKAVNIHFKIKDNIREKINNLELYYDSYIIWYNKLKGYISSDSDIFIDNISETDFSDYLSDIIDELLKKNIT